MLATEPGVAFLRIVFDAKFLNTLVFERQPNFRNSESREIFYLIFYNAG